MDALFSPSVLRDMRRLNDANLPHTCTVELPVTTKGPGGMSTTAWVAQRVLPCRYTDPSGSATEQIVADRADVRLQATVVFEAGAVVEPTARLLVTGLEPDGVTPFGKTLGVVRVDGPRANEIRRMVHVEDLRDDNAALATLTPGLTASVAVQPPVIALTEGA